MAASDVDHERIGLLNGNGPATPPDDEGEGAAMTLVEHLNELRRRLLICAIAVVVGTVIAFIFWQPILSFLLTPLPHEANYITHGTRLVIQGPLDGFSIALKLALAVGLALAAPVTLYQLWAFIAPGLTRRERRYAGPFTALAAGLFAVGVAVGFVVLRWPIEWLINFGHTDFFYLPDASKYISFVAFFLLAFGIVFELPLILTFLSLIGVVNSRLLRQKRAYALFGLWIASCFITPGADPFSPVIIGVAMTILYELSIVLMRVIGK
jgi:sec-independent protein translocase protein TatC